MGFSGDFHRFFCGFGNGTGMVIEIQSSGSPGRERERERERGGERYVILAKVFTSVGGW